MQDYCLVLYTLTMLVFAIFSAHCVGCNVILLFGIVYTYYVGRNVGLVKN